MGRRPRRSRRLAALAALFVGAAAGAPLAAQGGGSAMPVGFTEAITAPVRASIELTGSVESRSQSLVASEVSGLVAELTRRVGDTVRRNRPVARLRRVSAELRLASVEGELQEARAQRKLAETNRERAEQLFEEKVVSRQQLDDALAQYEASRGRIARFEAEVARLRDELERTVVRAPFDGVVVAEHTAVGEWIDGGEAVVEMVDINDLEIGLEVPEQFFSGLTRGTVVVVVVPALGGAEFAGEVRAVVPKADDRSRTFPVKVAISEPGGRIAVGMLARVALPVGEARDRVLVPKDALVSQGPARFVFLLGDDESARRVAVTAGESAGQWIAVEGEVAAGDRVVIQGNERLQPDQAVQPQRRQVARP